MPSMASTVSRNFFITTDKHRILATFPSFPDSKSPTAHNPLILRRLKCHSASESQPSSAAAQKLRANPLSFRLRAGDVFHMPKINGPTTTLFITVSLFASASASSSPGAATPEEAFVKQTVSAHDVVIFSKSYCPYCMRAKAVFKELNKVPHVIELDQRADGTEIQDALRGIVGRRTVPQVFVKGKHLGGSDDTVKAYQSGKLSQILSSAPEDKL